MPVRVLAINSSPKADGQTAKLLDIFTNEAKKLGLEVTVRNLYELKDQIPPFDGQLNEPAREVKGIYREIVDCDGFVIATPTYWFNMPGILKSFIDHLTILEEGGWMLEGKAAGIITYSPQGGEMGVLVPLALTLNHMGVTLPPYSLIFYRGSQDQWALDDIKLLAKSIIQQIKAQQQNNFSW